MSLSCHGWKNKNGTSKRSCTCGSWKSHWINNSGKLWPTYCSASDCMQRAEVGAHVINSVSKEEWIVPLCNSCNQRIDVFSLKNGTTLVLANKEKTGC